MTAIVEIAGQQFKVEPEAILNVPRLQGEPGSKVDFSNLLYVESGNETNIGKPYIEGKVTAEIIAHGRGDKIIVFHKKRRKGYKKLNGHKQDYTQIKIEEIKI